MLVINILFGTLEVSTVFLLFYHQIMILARSYDWLKEGFSLVLGWHKYVIIYSPMELFNWKIVHNYRVNYYNNITVWCTYLLGEAKRYRSLLPSFINKQKTANNKNSIYEWFNREDCYWKPCYHTFRYQKYNYKDHRAKDCPKRVA